MRYTGQHLSRLATCYYARLAGLLENIEEHVSDDGRCDGNEYKITPVDTPFVSGSGGKLREHWGRNLFFGDTGRKRFAPRKLLANSWRKRLIADVVVRNGKTVSI
jgi:hypothetical protein